MSSYREVEATYSPASGVDVPDLRTLTGVATTRVSAPAVLRSVYVDTPDLRLLRGGVSLCRRTGDTNEGWQLVVPAERGREETHAPLGRSTRVPPKSLRDLVVGWTRGRSLAPVAELRTERTATALLDAQGAVLAEFADDRVEGAALGGEPLAWREWELELVDGTDDLLDQADELLAASGVARTVVDRSIARLMGEQLVPPPALRPPQPGKPVSRVVHARLAAQVRALGLLDVEARRGEVEGVHQMRVTCRRLRGVLATFRPVLDRSRTDRVREELRWLVGVLGAARDAAVVRELLEQLLADEPRSLVRGPVRRRIRTTYAGRGAAELRAALHSSRYLAVRDRLDELVEDPPWTPIAQAPAEEIAPDLLARDLARLTARHETAASAAAPASALHEVRKAAKRMRYAAEALEPIGGTSVRRVAHEARRITSHLGELQDSEVCRAALMDLSQAASAAGEPTFTYGRLHALEQARAERLAAEYWTSQYLEALTSRTAQAITAIAGR